MPEVEPVPNCVPDYVQTALDQARSDLIELRESLEAWKQFTVDKEDLYNRIENWQFRILVCGVLLERLCIDSIA